MNGVLDPAYVQARKVLLDAIEALSEHRSAIVLIGAQAIYLRTGEGDLAVAPYTTDADLALNPESLGNEPLLETMLTRAGFTANTAQGPGSWIGAHGILIDLMVPDALAGPGRRSARLGVHGTQVARRGRGLEACLVDNAPMAIQALAADDPRAYTINVAGPAALVVAKIHKIHDRRDDPRREDDKDALDLFRILQATPSETLSSQMFRLTANPLSAQVTEEAINHLQSLFAHSDAPGSLMVGRAVQMVADPEELTQACAFLTSDLLSAIEQLRL